MTGHRSRQPDPPNKDASKHILKIRATNTNKVTKEFGEIKGAPIITDALLKVSDAMEIPCRLSIP